MGAPSCRLCHRCAVLTFPFIVSIILVFFYRASLNDLNLEIIAQTFYDEMQYRKPTTPGEAPRSEETEESSVDDDDSMGKTLLSDSLPGKPYIVLHLGPAKTGTTTIQNELTSWKENLLQSDNVLYTGAYYQGMNHLGAHPVEKQFYNLPCHKELAKTRNAWQQEKDEESRNSINGSLTEALESVPCFQKTLEMLKEFHANGTSLILSNEVKSTASANAFLRGYPDQVPLDWKSIAALLSQDWNFLCLIGHRPHLDWVSARVHTVVRPRQTSSSSTTFAVSIETFLCFLLRRYSPLCRFNRQRPR